MEPIRNQILKKSWTFRLEGLIWAGNKEDALSLSLSLYVLRFDIKHFAPLLLHDPL